MNRKAGMAGVAGMVISVTLKGMIFIAGVTADGFMPDTMTGQAGGGSPPEYGISILSRSILIPIPTFHLSLSCRRLLLPASGITAMPVTAITLTYRVARVAGGLYRQRRPAHLLNKAIMFSLTATLSLLSDRLAQLCQFKGSVAISC